MYHDSLDLQELFNARNFANFELSKALRKVEQAEFDLHTFIQTHYSEEWLRQIKADNKITAVEVYRTWKKMNCEEIGLAEAFEYVKSL